MEDTISKLLIKLRIGDCWHDGVLIGISYVVQADESPTIWVDLHGCCYGWQSGGGKFLQIVI